MLSFPQTCVTEASEAGGPRFGVLEVKALTGELDMKETVMETLLSHLEVCAARLYTEALLCRRRAPIIADAACNTVLRSSAPTSNLQPPRS